MLDIQSAIYKAYVQIKYNDTNTNRLTDDERKKLELSVKILSGSSDIFAQLTELLESLGKMMDNMTGKQKVTVMLGLALLLGGHFALNNYLTTNADIRLKEIEAETTRELEKTASKERLETLKID